MNFKLVGVEYSTFKKWDNEHKKVCKLYNKPFNEQPAIGGRLTFSFTPTGLGSGVTVKCACGEEKDCTNIDNW